MAQQHQLFEVVVVIGLRRSAANAQKPEAFVSYQFPPTESSKEPDNKEFLSTIAQFCFPEADAWLELAESGKSKKSRLGRGEQFSFVLTATDGAKKFGYCRRFAAKPNSEQKETKFKLIPECFVILSWLPAEGFFCEMLNIIEDRRRKGSSAQVFQFLKAVLAKPLPNPGESLTVRTFDDSQYVLKRPESVRSSVLFAKVLQFISVPVLLNLFSSLINEDRIILVSSHVSRLSSVVGILNNLLFPFSWQHIYIPVLPRALVMYCTAPMPFFVGMLRDDLAELEKYPMEEAVVMDLDDKGRLLKAAPEHFDATISKNLPSGPTNRLRSQLEGIAKPTLLGKGISSGIGQLFKRGHKRTPSTDSTDTSDATAAQIADNEQISGYFLGFFYDIFGGLENFFSASHKFNREAFIESRDPSVQPFLRGFETTQIYEMFVKEIELLHSDNAMDTFVLTENKFRQMHVLRETTVLPENSPAQAVPHEQRPKAKTLASSLPSGTCGSCGVASAPLGGLCDNCVNDFKRKKRGGFLSVITRGSRPRSDSNPQKPEDDGAKLSPRVGSPPALSISTSASYVEKKESAPGRRKDHRRSTSFDATMLEDAMQRKSATGLVKQPSVAPRVEGFSLAGAQSTAGRPPRPPRGPAAPVSRTSTTPKSALPLPVPKTAPVSGRGPSLVMNAPRFELRKSTDVASDSSNSRSSSASNSPAIRRLAKDNAPSRFSLSPGPSRSALKSTGTESPVPGRAAIVLPSQVRAPAPNSAGNCANCGKPKPRAGAYCPGCGERL